MRQHGRVFLAVGEDVAREGEFVMPDPALASAAAGVGLVRFRPDPDGVVRATVATDPAAGPPHGLATAPLVMSRLIRADGPVPVGRFFPGFHGDEDLYPQIPAAQVLLGKAPAGLFRQAFFLRLSDVFVLQ